MSPTDILWEALGGVGYALDTPRALAHGAVGNLADLVTGRNRVKGWRASGREMLHSMNLLGEDKPGWDRGDTAGLATELILDPINVFGGIGLIKKALKASRMAKAATTMKKVASVAKPAATRVPSMAMSFGLPTAGMGLMYANQEEQNPYMTGLAAALMGAPIGVGMAKAGKRMAGGYKPLGKKAMAEWVAAEEAKDAAKAAAKRVLPTTTIPTRKEIDFLEQRGIRAADKIKAIVDSARAKGIADLTGPEGASFVQPFIPRSTSYKPPSASSVLAALLGYNILAREGDRQ